MDDKKKHYPPLDISKQIDNLEEKGLLFRDKTYVAEYLNDISYFRLIKAYDRDFKSKNGSYCSNTYFDDILDLYFFDSNLKQLIFPLIEIVEINLRCRIVNYFSIKYGSFGYEDCANFYNSKFHSDFIDAIEKKKKDSKAPFVKNFINTYDPAKVPFYALVELFDFGMLSMFLNNMKYSDRNEIALTYQLNYGSKKGEFLSSWIRSISYVRNICAHHGRLYDFDLQFQPKLLDEDSRKKIQNNKIFCILVCIKRLLPKNKSHWIEFIDRISALLKKYSKLDKSKIGFFDDWEDILRE